MVLDFSWSRRAISVGLFITVAEISYAQSLCPHIGTYAQETSIGTVVNFVDFGPVKLVASGNSCDIKKFCEFRIGFETGNQISTRFEPFAINDLCDALKVTRSDFRRMPSEDDSQDEFPFYFDNYSVRELSIKGVGVEIVAERRDFNFDESSIGWLVPNLENSSGQLVSAPLGASAYNLEIIWE